MKVAKSMVEIYSVRRSYLPRKKMRCNVIKTKCLYIDELKCAVVISIAIYCIKQNIAINISEVLTL